MQKKLIALAIAGLSGAAFAQSNVTVYGQVNLAYQSLSGTNNVAAGGAKNTITSMGNADSRLGFKGEEALGGGLKAVFTMEFGVAADQANGTGVTSNAAGTSGLNLSARQTFVGMSGNWGTFTMGRQYTPFFEAAAAIDPFGASSTQVASTATIHPIAAIARADNSFKYVGAFDMAGGKLILAGLYGLSEKATEAANTIDNKVTNVKIAYAAGPLLVGLTQITLKDNVAGITTVSGIDTKATAFGGTYDLKTVKLHLLNDRVKVSGTNNTAIAAAAGIPPTNGFVAGAAAGVLTGTIVDRSDWMMGVSVPLGASTIKLSYNTLNDKTVANIDATHWGLGYNYAMSKRTNLFAQYAKVTTKNLGAGTPGYTLLGSSIGAGAARTTGLQLGMAHSF